MPNEVTIGELARRLDSFERRIADQFTNVNRTLETLQFVHRDTYTIQMSALVDRVEALEESKKWLARAFITSILFPVVVAVILAVALTR